MTDFSVYLGISLIFWKSNKQGTILKSSCETEHRERPPLLYVKGKGHHCYMWKGKATTVICEIQWLVYLFKDFKVPFEQSSLLYCDNDSARYITANPVFHERTKHIEIDCDIVRKKLKKCLIYLLLISTTEQLADIYTKVLGLSFKNICFKLGLINIYSGACWGFRGYE